MKLYKIPQSLVIESNDQFYLVEHQDWDHFFNDDYLFEKLKHYTKELQPHPEGKSLLNDVLTPIGDQEIWAAGVTYIRSKVERQAESKDSGGAEFYARVYEAERPELFFKANPHRVVGHGQKVRIRKDSNWDVPEPELTLAITSSGKIVGYTIGNDMSSRSIEGENPLYLPQAKCYDKSASIGPCIYVTDAPIPRETEISLEIIRKEKIFEGSVAVSQIKRSFQELVAFLYRECSFPEGCYLMTGTGIVPGNDFTLQSGDEIRIHIPVIGTLVNYVE